MILRAAAFFALSATLSAQWIHYPAPGTPRKRNGRPDVYGPAPRIHGKPDLSGIWTANYSAVPPVPKGAIIESSQGPDYSLQFWRDDAAPIPMTPWAEAIFKQRDRVFGAGGPSSRCLPHGIPDAMLVSNFKIVQNPGVTMILFEEFTRFRQIFTDGRGHPQVMNPAWLGYSIGKWDHETFVVDTVGFNDKSWLDDAGHPHSEQLHTIERFHRFDFGHMDMDLTIEDPVAYTKPWSVTVHFQLLPDTELIEDICENEKDAQHIAGLTADEHRGIALAPEMLSQYVGAYDVKSGHADIEHFDVSLVGGKLVMGGGVLTPLSETEFICPAGNIRFVKNPEGRVTGMIVAWVYGGENEFTK